MANYFNNYKTSERYMTYALIADTILFTLYLIVAGLGIVWLKVILAILCFGISGLLIWFLYTTQELMKHRSLWITVGAAAIAVCLLFSLILNFPSPNKYKPQDENTTAYFYSEKM